MNSSPLPNQDPKVSGFEQAQYAAGSLWYALRVKPNHEKTVSMLLREKKI
jgi:hypothetical protein